MVITYFFRVYAMSGNQHKLIIDTSIIVVDVKCIICILDQARLTLDQIFDLYGKFHSESFVRSFLLAFVSSHHLSFPDEAVDLLSQRGLRKIASITK